MVACNQETSGPDASPLRFGEILAAAEMMPDFGSLPLECWPGNQCLLPSHEETRLAAGPSLSNGALARMLARFTRLVATVLAAAFAR
jgi:hypothetical protein